LQKQVFFLNCLTLAGEGTMFLQDIRNDSPRDILSHTVTSKKTMNLLQHRWESVKSIKKKKKKKRN